MLCPLYSLHYHCERKKRVKHTGHYIVRERRGLKYRTLGRRGLNTLDNTIEVKGQNWWYYCNGRQWKLLLSAATDNEALRVGFTSSYTQYIIYSHSHTHTVLHTHTHIQYFTHTHTVLYLDMSMTTISQSDLSEGAKFPEYIVHLLS